MGLMVLGHRRTLRLLWLVGAGLLGAVVLKLFMVDLSGQGTIERIVSFVGVGILILVIGYLAPVPPSQDTAPGSADMKPRCSARSSDLRCCLSPRGTRGGDADAERLSLRLPLTLAQPDGLHVLELTEPIYRARSSRSLATCASSMPTAKRWRGPCCRATCRSRRRAHPSHCRSCPCPSSATCAPWC